MKLKLNLVFFIVFCFFSFQKTFSQCFQIESILVDACGPDEGLNEMVRFKVGSSDINTSNISVTWPSNSWQGLVKNITTGNKVAALNAEIIAAGGCGRLIEPTSGVLPANAKVILITSFNVDVTTNVFGAITDNIYVIFQNNATTTAGHFVNYNATSVIRTLVMSFGLCSDTVSYDKSLLININGTSGGSSALNDGASVNYTPSGAATYVNKGCVAPVEVFSVDAGNSPISACAGAKVSLSGTAVGQQLVAWTDGSAGGTFTTSSALGTDYTISSTASGTITLTLTATNPCSISKTSTVTLNVSPTITPTFNAIPHVCQNGTAPTLPTSSTNVPSISGTWNSTVSTATVGTITYTFTPNGVQCASIATLDVTVDNCGFGSFASAAWLNNCTTPAGQFYNITGTGANLINPSSPEGSFMTPMGSFIKDSGALIFKGGEIKTFKNTLGNVCGAKMFYNIHLQSDPAGTFTPITLNFFSDCISGAFKFGGGPCSPRDQKWQTTSNPVDLTALPKGNYVLEVYYTVSGSSVSNSGCNDTVTLNNGGINYLSSFSINAPTYSSSNPTTCGGSEGTITISGLTTNTIYSLSYNNGATTVGPTNLTSNASGAISITGLSAGTYSNFSLAFNSCSSVNNTPIVLVNPVLNSTITKTDNTVCQSSSVPCNGTATALPTDGSGSYSYLWNDASAQITATATGLCARSYCVKVTDLVSLCTIDKCITVGDAAILPVFNSLSTAAPSICAGGSAEFILSGTANAIITYTINGGTAQTVALDASGNVTVKVNGATTDTTVLVTNINLATCNVVLNDTKTVTISAVADAGTLSGNQTICSNGTSTFTSTRPNGVWSSSDSSIATIDISGLITAVSDGTATITYTVLGTGSCPDAKATRTITITAAPNAGVLSGNQAICINGTSNFSSTQIGGTWNSLDVSTATINSSGIITSISAGTVTISYTVTGTGGCSDATATRTITITNAPNAGVLSGIQTICSNGTTTFTSSQIGGTWSSLNIGTATVDNAGLITAVSAGTATITYTVLGSGGCSDAIATRTITVTAAPNAGIISGNQAICINGTSNFSSTKTGGTWSSSDVTIATINSAGTITPISTGTVTISYTVIGTGGCSDAIASRTITISALANAGIISGTDTICSNGITTFSSTQLNGSWSSSETSIASINSSGIITGISSGTSIISYTVTGIGGCPNAVATKNVSVSNPLVSITADCIDANYTLTAITNEANPTFTWFKGTTALTETSNTLIVKALDNYKVVVTSNGCSAEATENVTFFYCEIPRGISPNGDNKNDFFDLSNLHVNKLEIFNRYGVKVYSKSNYKKEWNGTTDSGQELPDATYYYVIEFESGKTKTGWVFINK